MWDSFELNKIAGGVIAGILMLFLINAIGGMLVHPESPEQAAYTPDGIEQFQLTEGGGSAAPAPKEPEVSALDLLASADAEKGAKVFKKCAACHNVDAGGANGTGPALYGVVGRAIADAGTGFAYSAALTDLGGTWGFAELDAFLANPKKFAKGTKMSFAGLKKPGDRAAVLAYLNNNSAAPLALPEPAPAPAMEEAAEEVVEEVVEAVEDAADAAAKMVEDAAEATEEAAEEAAE